LISSKNRKIKINNKKGNYNKLTVFKATWGKISFFYLFNDFAGTIQGRFMVTIDLNHFCIKASFFKFLS
jgi:uncharacterized cupin superfamily protein